MTYETFYEPTDDDLKALQADREMEKLEKSARAWVSNNVSNLDPEMAETLAFILIKHSPGYWLNVAWQFKRDWQNA